MPNIDKGDACVNYRCKKLEQLSVEQIQNARLVPASLLNYVRRAKSVFGDQRLAFLKLHLLNATFSNVESRDMRPVSLP